MTKSVPDFSLKIWHRPGMIALIIQEILRIYPYINRQEEMSEDDCRRVYSAIILLHPIAKDERLRAAFLRAEVPEYLYPFLMNPRESRRFKTVRLACLAVIGYLVQESDVETVKYLLQSEIVTLCIRCMEVHSCESTIAVVVFILEKILKTDIGLAFICDDQELYLKIIHLLASMFKHPRTTVCTTLRNYFPGTFKDGSSRRLFQGDKETLDRVLQVMLNTSFL